MSLAPEGSVSSPTEVDCAAVFAAMEGPAAILAADAPRFTVAMANEALLALTGRSRDEIVGRPLREAFGAEGEPPREDGVAHLQAVVGEAVRTGAAQRTARHRYGLPQRAGSRRARCWETLNTPVRGSNGVVQWILHQAYDVTAQVLDEEAAARAREALQVTETAAAQQLALLEAVYRDAPVGLAVLDRDLRFQRVNERLAEMNGLPAQAHIGRTVGEVVPLISAQVEAIARVVIETGRPVRDLSLSGETSATPGEIRHWHEQWFPLRDAAGTIIGLNVVIDDVTDRLRAEAALRESEERYRTLFESIDEGYVLGEVLVDSADRAVDLLLREINPAAVRLTGVLRAGHCVTELVPGVEQYWIEMCDQVARSGLSLRRERFAAPLDRWYDLHVSRVGGAGSRLVAITFRDITSRREAEAALRQSEARFRAVVDVVPDLLWQSAADGSTAWYNARWYEYTGQTPAQAAGWGWADAVHPDDRDGSVAAYANAARRGEAAQREHRIRAVDGTYRWFLARAEPQRDEAGRITGWFGAATDVHAQRLALEEVARLVAERTQELAHAEAARDELRRQLTSAEEDERRRLARELHDQLGQHLTAFALKLTESRRLLDAGKSADAQLTQLEELARVMTRDARHLALELRPPELDDVGFESALQTYVSQWTARFGIEAELEIMGDAASRPLAPDVATALYRIAQEALTNVARHAGAEHVTVLLDKRGGEARLVVEDDGRGFDVDEGAARIRAERRLGLAGMRERAALSGGSLEVESTPGRGTAVYVRVPLGVAADRSTA